MIEAWWLSVALNISGLLFWLLLSLLGGHLAEFCLDTLPSTSVAHELWWWLSLFMQLRQRPALQLQISGTPQTHSIQHNIAQHNNTTHTQYNTNTHTHTHTHTITQGIDTLPLRFCVGKFLCPALFSASRTHKRALAESGQLVQRSACTSHQSLEGLSNQQLVASCRVYASR